MAQYRPPLRDIKFTLECMAGMADWTRFERFQEAQGDLVGAVLEEAAKLAADVIAPTNRIGDLEGATLVDGVVTTPDAFKPMHQAFVDGGWTTLPFDSQYGGQELPNALAIAVTEMFTSANMAYSLNSLLSFGAIEAISSHADDKQKELYLPNLVSGKWSATMNLTEPSAGSDVGALKTRAERQEDGSYLITGQKIFITWGEHDLSENIIHLVLARLPDAPEGTRGISMFLVPKYHVNGDGSLGARNDLTCVSLEHKLGIHASPTCVMSFGDNGACRGYLVGEENRGMRNMFTMMNHARLGVGLQGVALGERAYQDAAEYALERVQSPLVGANDKGAVPIINHGDVRRMLLSMRAYSEACRAIVYRNAWAIDRAHAESEPVARSLAQGEADLLTPISKAFATDIGVQVASEGLQVFGGMGFIEETGAAQHYRDIRIAPIYEGTNGIQAMDLIGRKLQLNGGQHWRNLLTEMEEFLEDIPGKMASRTEALRRSVQALSQACSHIFDLTQSDVRSAAAVSVPFLHLFGHVFGAYLLAQQAVEAESRLNAGGEADGFLNAKIQTALFFIDHLLPSGVSKLGSVLAGGSLINDFDVEEFARN